MNQVVKAEQQDYTKEKALVETVRASIFPNSTDEQLMLYFHKCQTMGVHPLDNMIHPSIYKGKDGEPDKVVFVTSIDVLRSRSVESGLEDGIDEPEYGPEMVVELSGESITVPEWVKVRVYKKDITRPYTGIARWKEYYPGDKRGHQYRQKPYLMLTKCAEALARRLAFPKELDKLYTPEEMEATTAMLAQIAPPSSKPSVSPDQVKVSNKPAAGKVGTVQDVAEKTGSNAKGMYTRYGVKIDGATYGTFDDALGDLAKELKGKRVVYTHQKNGKYENLTSLVAFQEPSKPSPASDVMDQEDFEKLVFSLLLGCGLTEDQLDAKLDAEFSIQGGINNVPADLQGQVINYLSDLQEQPGA